MRSGLTFVMNVNGFVQFEHHPFLLPPEVLQDGDEADLLLPCHADAALFHPLKVVRLEVGYQLPEEGKQVLLLLQLEEAVDVRVQLGEGLLRHDASALNR